MIKKASSRIRFAIPPFSSRNFYLLPLLLIFSYQLHAQQLSFSEMIPVWDQEGWVRCIVVEDMDLDGDLDLLSYSNGPLNNYLLVCFDNYGDGGFNYGRILLRTDHTFSRFFATDLNNDSYPDLIISYYQESPLWLANDGQGNLVDLQPLSSLNLGYHSINPEDIDGDGDQDIFAIDEDEEMIIWLPNQGDGTFGEAIEIATKRSFLIADLDGDDDPDLLTETYWGEHIWYANDGQGNFTIQNTFEDVGGYWGMTVADLDNDGDQDLLAYTGNMSHNDSIFWYANDGNQHFTEQPRFAGSRYTYSPMVVDLDNDDDLDVVALCNHNEITWFANNGDGDFSSGQVIGFGSYQSEYLIAADLDGDDDIDIVTASARFNAPCIGWFRNELISAGTTPNEYQILANYPNPFNQSTFISFKLAATSGVDLRIYDILGREISVLASGFFAPGTHLVRFDGDGLNSGTYICMIKVDNKTDRHRITLLK